MYIDFHTHAFNEKIAKKAIENLEKKADQKALTDGTIGGLLKRLDEWHVDRAVMLPIATKPSQQEIINDWAAGLFKSTNGKIIPFGSVHPEAGDALCELERIKELGLFGVKLHPDYQDFVIDEERLFPIYKKCAELGLPVVFHAGYDCVSPDFIHARPKNSLNAFRAVPEMTMILAHLGGNELWEDVYSTLAGESGNLYFDISFVADKIDDDLFFRIVKKHGADRILLASDCPWDDCTNEINLVKRTPISDAEKELIFHGNAERLLGLDKKI